MIGPYEFEPQAHAVNASLRIAEPEVERALAPFRAGQDQAVTSAGWDGAAPVPWEHIRED